MRLHARCFMSIPCPLSLSFPQKSHYSCPAVNMQRSESETTDTLLVRWTTSGWLGSKPSTLSHQSGGFHWVFPHLISWGDETQAPVLFPPCSHCPRAPPACVVSSWLPLPGNFWPHRSISAKFGSGVEAFSTLRSSTLRFISWNQGERWR